MFITYKPAEIFLGAYLDDDSTQYWQYVEQTTHCPWFYVRVGRHQGSEVRISEHRDRPFRLIVTAHFANA